MSNGVWTDILLRTSLQDNGTIPAPGYPYTSPDVICTVQNQVANPTQFFTNNYATDPYQSPIASQNNFVYMRGKNLGNQPSGGTCFLFWATSSFVMLPAQWAPNALQAYVNNQWQGYNTMPQVAGGQISVTQVPFTWAPTPPPPNQHYCLIGALSTQQHPWSVSSIPAFSTLDAFIVWVRGNQNVCWRNLTLVSNPNQPSWDRLDFVSNTNTERILVLEAKCSNVPVGTTVTLRNNVLGINTVQVTTSLNQTIVSQGALCPANYTGYIETKAVLPGGLTWPTGALITTKLWAGVSSSSPAAVFGEDFGPLETHPHIQQVRQRLGNGQLVVVGNCATGYQPGV